MQHPATPLQHPWSFCVLSVWKYVNNIELEVCEQHHMSNIEQYMAMVARCELTAMDNDHLLGVWYPVSEHLHASLCWRCGAMVWLTKPGNETRWRPGGTALEEECWKKDLCSMQDIDAPAPRAQCRLLLFI